MSVLRLPREDRKLNRAIVGFSIEFSVPTDSRLLDAFHSMDESRGVACAQRGEPSR